MKPFKIGRRARRHLTHNENPCTGRRCAECTPSSRGKLSKHRAEASA